MFDVDLAQTSIVVLVVCRDQSERHVHGSWRAGGYNLTLVARRAEPLAQVAEQIKSESGVTVNIETDIDRAARQADVIIAVTSALEGILDEKSLKPGAIICDVARPCNVSKAVAEKRKDVFVFEGGVVTPPGDDVQFNFNFGFPPKTCYACMADTIVWLWISVTKVLASVEISMSTK